MPPPCPTEDIGWTRRGIVSRASLRDIHEVHGRLRAADKRELEDITGRAALVSLQLSLLCGEPCLALSSTTGERLAILSAIRTGASSAALALSGTARIEDHSSAFLRGSREVLDRLHDSYDLLFNVCDSRNETHLRWLGWLGFREIRTIPSYGHAGIPVVEFAKLRSS